MQGLFRYGLPLLLASAVLSPASPQEAAKPPADDPPTCAGGCAAASPSENRPDTKQADALLAALRGLPAGESCHALDEVLYYRIETAPRIESAPLSDAWKTFLRRELARSTVRLTVRVIGADDRLHVGVEKEIPLDRKSHVHPDTVDGVQPPEVALTPRRVGLHHIWARV